MSDDKFSIGCVTIMTIALLMVLMKGCKIERDASSYDKCIQKYTPQECRK
jgi:hypothetical protein